MGEVGSQARNRHRSGDRATRDGREGRERVWQSTSRAGFAFGSTSHHIVGTFYSTLYCMYCPWAY
jgi:hypothetical protein